MLKMRWKNVIDKGTSGVEIQRKSIIHSRDLQRKSIMHLPTKGLLA